MHWTYQSIGESSTLRQGDIIAPTPELRSLFKIVHPHFDSDRFIAFLVTSQSCDLELRNGKSCSAHYINVAAAKPLSSIFQTLIDHVCPNPILRSAEHQNLYSESDRRKLGMFFESLFNQNEWKLGLFYLHADASVQIGESSVAILRVSIALKRDHYETLLNARCGRLSDNFANKLGWMTGNLYSRIGVDDWSEAQLKELKDKAFLESKFQHITESAKRLLEANKIKLAECSVEQIRNPETIPGFKPFKVLFLEAVKRDLEKRCKELDANSIEQVVRAISNNNMVNQFSKQL